MNMHSEEHCQYSGKTLRHWKKSTLPKEYHDYLMMISPWIQRTRSEITEELTSLMKSDSPRFLRLLGDELEPLGPI